MIGFLMDTDAHRCCVGMARAVVQRLLDNPVDASLVFVGKIVGIEFRGYAHVHRRTLGNLARLPLQRGDQAQIVEHRRPQQQSHVTHNTDRVFDKALGAFDMLADLLGAAQPG